MQTESVIPLVSTGTAARPAAAVEDELADFSTDRRVLLLSAMALVIGAIGSLVAYVLIWLMAAITNLAFYQRWSAAPAEPIRVRLRFSPQSARGFVLCSTQQQCVFVLDQPNHLLSFGNFQRLS